MFYDVGTTNISFCNMFVLSRGDDEDEEFFVDDQDVNRLIKLSHVLDFFFVVLQYGASNFPACRHN